MEKLDILDWLREDDPEKLKELWARADAARRQFVGDAVHLRGLIEASNYCARRCTYCGISAENANLPRYRMTEEEILGCAKLAVELGYGTVVIQAGEDPGLTGPLIAGIVRRIKRETPLAVTLSLGERSADDYKLWRDAGADRYLLRFETSNRRLYDRIHPPKGREPSDRFALLRILQSLGYEVGSGVMIGLPGQTYDDLAEDILSFARLELEMIGVGPYLPHPETPLGKVAGEISAGAEQVPNSEGMTYKVVALTRLACPWANIPSTTALATLNKATGRELGLSRGANIVMPNLTPVQYRAMYEIYPAKACVYESAADCNNCLRKRIESIGRTVGAGRGDSARKAWLADSEGIRDPNRV